MLSDTRGDVDSESESSSSSSESDTDWMTDVGDRGDVVEGFSPESLVLVVGSLAAAELVAVPSSGAAVVVVELGVSFDGTACCCASLLVLSSLCSLALPIRAASRRAAHVAATSADAARSL